MATDPYAATRRYGYVLGGISIVAFLAVGTLYFNGALQDRQDPNRNLVVAPGASQLVLQRNRAGHYIAPGEINGQPVRFLLDTGATGVRQLPPQNDDFRGVASSISKGFQAISPNMLVGARL